MHTLKTILGNKMKHVLIGGIALGLLAVGVVSAFSLHEVRAAAIPVISGDIKGYAWSSTIGWISLNCEQGSSVGGSVCDASDYKVSVDPDSASRAFSGYAWSPHIGWISFNASEVIPHCGAPGARLSATGVADGWAWVMSGTTASGADGCISLHSIMGPYYAVTADTTTGDLGGFAWGSTTVGWIDFSNATFGAPPELPLVDLKTRDSGGILLDGPLTFPTLDPVDGTTYSSNLEWTSAFVSSCTASASFPSTDWNATTSISTSGGQIVSFPANTPGSYTYTITCRPTDTALADVTDSVTFILVDGTSTTPTIDLKISGPSGLTDGPYTLPSSAGGSMPLVWTSTGMGSCRASAVTPSIADWGTTVTTVAVTGTSTVSLPVNTGTTVDTYVYRLSCTPTGGGSDLSDTVAINVPPPGTTGTTTGGTTGRTGPILPWEEF